MAPDTAADQPTLRKRGMLIEHNMPPIRPASKPPTDIAQPQTDCNHRLKVRWSGLRCDCGLRWECY